MKSVIFTGGIGVGKSYFAQKWAEMHGQQYLSFDALWGEALATEEISNLVASRFNLPIRHNGIDKRMLSEFVFSSEEVMAEYMELIEQDVSVVMNDMLLQAADGPCTFEIPLGYKWKPMDVIDPNKINYIGVFAFNERRLISIVSRDHEHDEQRILRKMSLQPYPDEYMHLCHACIWNDYNPDTTESILKAISARFSD